MKELILEKEKYSFLINYMPLSSKCIESSKSVSENNTVAFNVKDFSDFQDMMNFDIVNDGMDNQDTVNELGKKMYQLYDIILAQKS